jgi:hypothetical protein
VCTTIQIVYQLLEAKYLTDEFEYNTGQTIPRTLRTIFLFYANVLSIIIPIFINYFVFYFYVRESYKSVFVMKKTMMFSVDEILRYTDVKTAKGINDFLD